MGTDDRRVRVAGGGGPARTGGARSNGLRVVPGGLGPLEPRRLVEHAEAALEVVVGAVGGPATGRLGRVPSDAVGACYLDLWICDRLLRHDGGGRSAAAQCLVPLLLLEGVGGLAAALGAGLHRPEPAAVEYRRRRRVLVRAARERSPQVWGRLARRMDRLAAGEDRLAHPLTAVRHRALPRPLPELVGGLEEERHRLAAAVAREPAADVRYGPAERYALLTAAAACVDGWQPRDTGVHDTTLGIGARRARLCGALCRLSVRLDLPVSEAARTAWRADVLRCAVA
ncbi:hypothetical protein ACF08B_24215 [Streptomyces sp. NPDC015139]|uniref:hypothetical protein n=1 Tax=Streptomyces sp. NPDC015139 TaxID=3364942 RepID=UPI0036F9290C